MLPPTTQTTVNEMNHPVIRALLEIIERTPYPDDHTSQFWVLEGKRLRIEAREGRLALHGFLTTNEHRWGLFQRAMRAVERWSYRGVTTALRSYPRVWSLAQRLAHDLGQGLSYDVWRLAVALSVLADHWEQHRLSPSTVALIGDGDGFLGALIHRYVPGARIYAIDLPKALLFQACTHRKADPQAALGRMTDGQAETATVVFVLPQEILQMTGTIDCAVNIASMQEMTPGSIAAYFAWLRRRRGADSHFYCVNRLDKRLPGGQTTRFLDYPWQADDQAWIDGACGYYRHFLAPYTLPHGPRFLGLRVPCINSFEGVIMHRLVCLGPAASEPRQEARIPDAIATASAADGSGRASR